VSAGRLAEDGRGRQSIETDGVRARVYYPDRTRRKRSWIRTATLNLYRAPDERMEPRLTLSDLFLKWAKNNALGSRLWMRTLCDGGDLRRGWGWCGAGD